MRSGAIPCSATEGGGRARRIDPEATLKAVPSIYDLKPRFQALLRPGVRALVGRGVTPNHLTIAAFVGSVLAGLLLLLARERPVFLLVLPLWLFARMALNAMDGLAAREHAMTSRLGAVLNEMGDALSDVALYLPVAALGPGLLWPAVAFCLGAVLTEFAGVLGQALGARRHYDGPMGKSDRAFLLGAMGLAGALAPHTLSWWPALLAIGAVLALATTAHRLARALRELEGAAPR
jgi:CDP-diacylglycerol--glycerol-3-phosphate 3-phosphatidyltransferase